MNHEIAIFVKYQIVFFATIYKKLFAKDGYKL